jgi:Acetyltransferase (GNAT) domain
VSNPPCIQSIPKDTIIEALNPLMMSSWNDSVAGFAGALPFHTSDWLDVLQVTYGFEPIYLCAHQGEAIQAILPLVEMDSWLTGRKAVGLPFTDLCPVLGDVALLTRLWDEARSIGINKAWKYIECRGAERDFIPGGASISYISHEVNLQSSEVELFANLKSSIRTAIRKAEKTEMKVDFDPSLLAIKDYFDLHCRTRRRHGLPPQPYYFFENLHSRMIERNRGFVVTARKDGVPIASSIFLHSFGHAVYKFGASDERYQEFRGSNLIMWQGMLHCKKLGCHTLHMGRTASTNEGLQRFKLGFGATERPLYYFRVNVAQSTVDKITDRSEGQMNTIFKHVPTWAARKLGEWLYRHAS